MLVNRPMIIVYDGKGVTHLFADGKVYGDGITGILFEHKEAKTPKNPDIKVRITADDVNVKGEDNLKVLDAFRNKIDRIMQKNKASANDSTDADA